METSSNEMAVNTTAAFVFHISGEPAIAINGVPDVNPNLVPLSQLDSSEDLELDEEPCFGAWMEGREVRKMFGNKYYTGEVVKFDKEMNWYRVVYEDGDFEDLDWHELEEVLVPLDIATPLKKLALKIMKHGKAFRDCGEHTDKPRKRHGRHSEVQK